MRKKVPVYGLDPDKLVVELRHTPIGLDPLPISKPAIQVAFCTLA
jgi:hypothetical protein